jgi:hypothetical protein
VTTFLLWPPAQMRALVSAACFATLGFEGFRFAYMSGGAGIGEEGQKGRRATVLTHSLMHALSRWVPRREMTWNLQVDAVGFFWWNLDLLSSISRGGYG